jgi:heptosyltransferase-2
MGAPARPRRRRVVTSTVPRFVVFAPNWLGDAVMALPAIADLRRAWPGARLIVAARPAIAPLFSMVNGIDDVVALEQRNGGESWPADTAVILPNSFHAALTAWRAGIPERWGYRTEWRRPLLTRAIDPPGRVHQVEYYQRLIAALAQTGAPPRALPRVVLSDELRRIGIEELTSAGWDGVRPLVALAPGAAYGGAKRWPPASFAALVRALAADGIQSAMVGSRADLPVAREIERALGFDRATDLPPSSTAGEGMLNLMGTDLPTLAGILVACRALVSNDSGAMHLGAALGVRVTAVFGPTDEGITRPAGDAHVVLTNPVWCRPCLMRECPIDHRCMRGIDAERVLGAVRQML